MSHAVLKVENRLGWLEITRPQALNALNAAVLKDLNTALDEVDQMAARRELAVLVIRGSGDKAFVAGADIKEMQGLNADQARAFAEVGQKVFRRLEVLPVPVIAAIHGFALGGGLELALSCDFVYATQNAKLGLPEVTLGLIPGFGGTQRLARAVGVQKAREWIFTGQMVTAQEAQAAGLVNAVFPDTESLWAAVTKTASTIAARGPLAVREAKKALLEGLKMDIDSGLELERDLFGDLFSFSDVTEGLAAFVEKRTPQFKGH